MLALCLSPLIWFGGFCEAPVTELPVGDPFADVSDAELAEWVWRSDVDMCGHPDCDEEDDVY